jgi:hypothetical protein
MSTGELIKTYFGVKFFNLKEECYVISNYYKKISFCLIDLLFHFIYLFINPYRVSKKFLKEKNEPNLHLYGETPLSTFETIIKEAKILPTNSFLELGVGRGRCSFWLSQFVGCSIQSVEWVPTFHHIASLISKIFRLKNISHCCQDMYAMNFKNTDFIFLYGTCLEDREILCLIEKFKKMDRGVKVISISFPLNDYDQEFKTIEKFPVLFPWGETECFINVY